MQTVSREEKLILQMKNIEAIVTDKNASAEQKVFMVTQQMSYLNELIRGIIQPLKDEAGDSELIKMAEDTFVDFIKGSEWP
jgi:hypothetical protein